MIGKNTSEKNLKIQHKKETSPKNKKNIRKKLNPLLYFLQKISETNSTTTFAKQHSLLEI